MTVSTVTDVTKAENLVQWTRESKANKRSCLCLVTAYTHE